MGNCFREELGRRSAHAKASDNKPKLETSAMAHGKLFCIFPRQLLTGWWGCCRDASNGNEMYRTGLAFAPVPSPVSPRSGVQACTHRTDLRVT